MLAIVLLYSFCITWFQTHGQECNEKLDIIFLVDSSLSIRESNPEDNSYDNWQLIKDFVSLISERIEVGQDKTQIGLLKFSTAVDENEIFHLQDAHSQQDFKTHIQMLSFTGGNTNTSGALRYLTTSMFQPSKGNRDYVDDIAVLLTDGLSNVDQSMTTTEALNTKLQGIKIFTIGISELTDGGELQEIASDPVDFHHMKLDHFTQLNGVIDLLLGRICTNRPPPETPCRNDRIDLCIIMDESGSIYDKNPVGAPGNYNWDLMKKFVAAIIENFQIGKDKSQISVMKFSTTATVKFHLNDMNNTEDMVTTVLNFPHLSGSTNTSGALRVMRQQVFQQTSGDRKGIPNVGIIITDGESTIDRNLTAFEAMKAKQEEITIFMVGITNRVDFDELVTIASPPSERHVFYSAELDQVLRTTTRLVWSVCNEVPLCNVNDDTCYPEEAKCNDDSNLVWEAYPKHLLLGYNHARLQDVETVDQCKMYCLQDPNCKSIDYISFAEECSISYITKDDQPSDFVQDTISEYHQWKCMVQDTNPGGLPDTNSDSGYINDNPHSPGTGIGPRVDSGNNGISKGSLMTGNYLTKILALVCVLVM